MWPYLPEAPRKPARVLELESEIVNAYPTPPELLVSAEDYNIIEQYLEDTKAFNIEMGWVLPDLRDTRLVPGIHGRTGFCVIRKLT